MYQLDKKEVKKHGGEVRYYSLPFVDLFFWDENDYILWRNDISPQLEKEEITTENGGVFVTIKVRM